MENKETRKQRAARQQREQDAHFETHIINTKCEHSFATEVKDERNPHFGLMYCKRCDSYLKKHAACLKQKPRLLTGVYHLVYLNTDAY